MNKTMKKITCGVLATVSMLGCAATLTACETSYPEVKMQIEFNDETYTLNYKLNRKVAPETVNHFLWLAGNGYYDGLCIHDYDVSVNRMYTGAYTFSENNDLAYKKYFEEIATYGNYKDFPHSVWMDSEKANPAYTLRGEFGNNDFRVESGALDETFGSLTMYYYDVSSYETAANTKIYVTNPNDKAELRRRDYKYNHTTSMFYISLSTATKSNNGYCTFATLNEKGQDVLEDLQAAIADYIEDNYGENESEFTTSVTETVLTDDALFGDYAINKTFKAPNEPIVIKSVKVTKY